jgi:hypothetical protein
MRHPTAARNTRSGPSWDSGSTAWAATAYCELRLSINSIIERQTTSVDPIGGDYVDAPQQTSYAGCPNSHYWKLGPADIEWEPDPDRRYGETVGE